MPLTPTETRSALAELGRKPDKKLGQNFLVDGNVARASLAMARLGESEKVVEIGPGLGTLTGLLLDAGHSVHAIELDSRLAGRLKKVFAEELEKGRFHLVEGDAVKHPIGDLPDEVVDFHVVANLPYAISSPWLDALLATKRLPVRMVLMLQKEAAERYLAEHGSKSYGALAICLSAAYQAKETRSVSRKCFHPVPAVDSVLLRLDRVDFPFSYSKEAHSLVRSLFTRRRKQLGSLAKAESSENQARVEAWLEKVKLSPTLRPEQVASAFWRSL